MHQTQGYCKLCVITAQKIKIFTKKMKKHIFFLWLALLQIQIVASELTHRPTHTTLTHSTHTTYAQAKTYTLYSHPHACLKKMNSDTSSQHVLKPTRKSWKIHRNSSPHGIEPGTYPPGNPRKSTEIHLHMGSNRGPPPPEERALLRRCRPTGRRPVRMKKHILCIPCFHFHLSRWVTVSSSANGNFCQINCDYLY